jgi:hypothetical protein
MRLAIPATFLALAGAAVLVTLPPALVAGESARDAVERLMPQLLSDDDTQRADAEKSLFALGDAGRTELERITRENDPRRAVTALRLLQSPKWSKTGTEPGEQRAQREDGATDSNLPAELEQRLQEMRARLDRQAEELRRRFETFDRDFAVRLPQFEFRPGGQGGASSGTIVENENKLSWTIDAGGRVKVTVQDGKDAPEQKYEAESMEALKREHPDVAKRLETVTGGDWTTIWRGSMSPRVRIERGPRGSEPKLDAPFDFGAPATPVLGISWSPVPDVLRDQLELGTGGMVVEQVVEKSLAEKLGLAKHDVLLEVQGKPVAGSSDVRALLENSKEGEKVTALVVRKGQRKTLEAVK